MSMLSRFATLAAPAAEGIQYVGGTSAQITGSTSTTTNISLTALTGGVGSAPVAGDYVIVYYGASSTANRALTVTTSGYTQVSDIYVSSTFDANLTVAYKLMTATPDTQVTVSATGATSDAGAVAVQVWRGVDNLVVFDVNPTSNNQNNTANINLPPITPVTAGTVVVSGGASAHNLGVQTFTGSDLSNFVTFSGPNSTNDVTIGLGSFNWVSGAYDPANLTFSGTDSTSFSSASVTLALLKQQTGPGPFIIAQASSQRGTNGTTLVINKPTGTREGDLMVAFMNIPSNSTWTGDTSWTEVLDQGTNPSTRIAYKVAGASEGASYTFTSTASSTSSGTIATYRNAAYDAVGAITSGANPLVLSAVTATAPYARILSTAARSATSITITGPATMQTIAIDSDAVSPSRLVEQDTNLSSAGSSGTRSFTVGSTTSVSGALVAIKPAASYTKYASYITANSTTAGGGAAYSTTIVNNTPSSVPGNLLVWVVSYSIDTNTTITISTPSGWTLLSGASNSGVGDQPGMYVFYRTVDGTEAASYTATASTACALTSSMVVLAGAGTLTAGTTNTGLNTTSITANAVTAGTNDILLYFGAQANADIGIPTFTPPSGMTEAIDVSANNNAQVVALEVAYQEGLSAGSTGNKTATSSTTNTRFRALLVTVAGK